MNSLLVGHSYHEGTCDFTVWAPNCSQVNLLFEDTKPLKMQKAKGGYWKTTTSVKPNALYQFLLDEKVVKPDPASHFQPNGVFGKSKVVDHREFPWEDKDWTGLDLKDLLFYELHVGTFTPQGTFQSTKERIKELAEFGFNAVELLPITQFSGKRNWGYDGVFPFSIQNTYGTPNDFKALVNECHLHGVALFIDLVYNHLGPEGNCLNDYGPYFPSDKMGRWGATINLDGPLSHGVRAYFLQNTLHWLNHYRIDGIRLDAILSMQDSSPTHFLQELNQTVDKYRERTGKKVHLIAETSYNISEVMLPKERGGFGFDGQWLDDFQHALFTLLTQERAGYYQPYGDLRHLIEALSDAYVYVGFDSSFRPRRSDESFRCIPANSFIVFSQNHDQVGNRLLGDRLICISGLEAAKLAAGMVLLSPYVPLLFMGEEYGETAPFLFFTDYQSKQLIDNIREGRRKEFADFHWQGDVPEPQSLETFEKSKLNWQQRYLGLGKKISSYYRALIQLRKKHAIFHSYVNRQIKHITCQNDKILFIQKQAQTGQTQAVIIANFSKEPKTYSFPFNGSGYRKVLDSADSAWAGQGSSVPETAVKGDIHTINGFNFIVFLNLMDGKYNGD